MNQYAKVLLNGFLAGIPLGVMVSVYLFFNNDWFHNYYMSQLTNPYLMGASALLGIFLAWKFD